MVTRLATSIQRKGVRRGGSIKYNLARTMKTGPASPITQTYIYYRHREV